MTEVKINNERASDTHGLRLLDDLIQEYYEAIKYKAKDDAKLGDLLKMLELRRKLTPESTEKKELWDLLERIRGESMKNHPLTDPKPGQPPKSRTQAA